MEYLLAINIGPVQEFIASARRCRDLWFGSWLLSELSKAGAKQIVLQNGLESLIFPAPAALEDLNPNTPFSVANKILALISQSPEELGNQVREAIINRLEEIKIAAYSHIPGYAKAINESAAGAQVKDLVEYFWAAVPFDQTAPGANGYATARRLAETLLAARKVTHDFRSVTWGASVPKSSLDGKRESVIPEEAFDELSEKELRKHYGVRRGERLCGVGLLKRHGNRGSGDRFFSTSHVAALSLLNRLTQEAEPVVKNYIAQLLDIGIDKGDLGRVPGKPHPAFGNYDGHLLFEERLQEFFDDTTDLQRARQSLRSFLRSALGASHPMPYYALLLADGDSMSRLIDNQRSAADHRKLSLALARFAASVKTIVEERYGGSLVYSGGDDILAFVPLHQVLPCARELSELFKESLGEFDDKNQPFISLSAGIAVVHHLEPLSDALVLARSAERTAKGLPGKNALAVTISKRSGIDTTITGKWDSFYDRLQKFISLHRKNKDAIPDSAAYQLRDLSLRLKPTVGFKDSEFLDKAMRFEAVRILQRKRSAHGRQKIDDTVVQDLEAFINSPDLTVSQLAYELIVARTFAEAADTAQLA